jgi:hypothetical protein
MIPVPTILFLILPFAALLFLARLLCSVFSPKIREQMRKYPTIHTIWACLAFLGFLTITGFLNPFAWPPKFMERRTQRAEVMERVRSAGGWDALRHDCVLLARTNEFVHWYRGFTNDAPILPPTIAALKPREVEFVSPKFLSNGPEEFRIPVVRIKLFGMHATGGRSTPYFGLEVVISPSSEGYTPKARPAASGNGHTNYRKVSEGVYEVF